MYRNCIFCSGGLGTNDSVEEFPIGRSLAFDAGRGRLWAVCPRCGRWNLAPIEERWEAVETAEKLFSASRMRAQSENIGLARLPDGTRLIRVGAALPGELAVWRYGDQLVQRRNRYLMLSLGAVAATTALVWAGAAAAGVSVFGFWQFYQVGRVPLEFAQGQRVVQRLPPGMSGGRVVVVRRKHLRDAYVSDSGSSSTLALHVPSLTVSPAGAGNQPLVLTGSRAETALGRAMVHVNHKGAKRETLLTAVDLLAAGGSPADYVRDAARARWRLGAGSKRGEGALPAARSLALEMALHEESERRTLAGELVMLESAWRDAEVIARIADALPGDPDDPPLPGRLVLPSEG
ncbi:MAG TPA: hypothetical protein VFE05_05475 [Longimicrobiaceae bacterium]|jgi:hypothetical protein|nr:hypothetical protein [Longimicrobiaceae bacterium]